MYVKWLAWGLLSLIFLYAKVLAYSHVLLNIEYAKNVSTEPTLSNVRMLSKCPKVKFMSTLYRLFPGVIVEHMWTNSCSREKYLLLHSQEPTCPVTTEHLSSRLHLNTWTYTVAGSMPLNNMNNTRAYLLGTHLFIYSGTWLSRSTNGTVPTCHCTLLMQPQPQQQQEWGWQLFQGSHSLWELIRAF